MSKATRSRRAAIDTSQVIIVDVQERLTPLIHEHAAVVKQAARFVDAAAVMGLPMVLSEQYVKGLGATVEPVRAAAERAGARRIEKMAFSVMGDAAGREIVCGREREIGGATGDVRESDRAGARDTVFLVGIETHVCVQQTVLDLLDAGMRPIVLADAVGSRRESDRDVALARMRAEGAVVTTVESAIYELMEKAGTELFKRVLAIVKE